MKLEQEKYFCDIIIPVYNAHDYLVKCVDSVLKNTNFEDNKIILIDDASTDDKIKPLLEKFSLENKMIEVLYNEENLGFVRTVNRAMKSSENDVLLLNSDTEVTKNWMKKIKSCAYSRELVATVTPLSNNATLVSVPEPFQDNILPEGTTLDEYANAVEKCSELEYPELPTGHGFCMYIKRSVLKKVGYFDEKSFGKGYGEENDFCFRCFNYGYSHLLCDNTYIYHKESQSFSEEKTKLIEDGVKVLKERYPEYKERLDGWCIQSPLTYIGKNISLYLGFLKKRKNILIVIHDWKNVDSHVGGTTLHVLDLISTMRKDFNFHVFAPDGDRFLLTSYWENTQTTYEYDGVIAFTKYHLYNNTYRELITEIMDDYQINLVHIHHMIGHYFDLLDVIKEKKLFSMFSLHDFYGACPLINKLHLNKEYCKVSSIEKCNECLSQVENMDAKFIDVWRKEWKKFYEGIDLIIAPSQNAINVLKETYETVEAKVIEHGINIEKNPVNEYEMDAFNVAFIGAIGIHKGRNILEKMVMQGSLGNVKVHIFGMIDNFKMKNNKNYHFHGKYVRDELPGLLKENKIQLICLFSIWPETYSYTLTESIACGVPVIAHDLGAVAERVKKYKFGWLIDVHSSTDEYVNKIKEIASDKESYKEVLRNLEQYKIKTLEEMREEYYEIYLSQSSAFKDIDYNKLKNNFKKEKRFVPYVPYGNYEWVFSTFKWKLISKFKIPLFLKRYFRKIKGD